MFEGIGRIGSYAQQWKLKRMAHTKITTGQVVDLNQRQSFSSAISLFQTNTKKAQQSKKTARSQAIKAKMNAIKMKLKRGKKLSAEDLKCLKDNAPALYQKAKVIQRAREELEADLKRCKSKEEVRQALLRASMKIEGQAAQADAGAAAASGGMSASPSAGGAVAGTAGAAMSAGGAAVGSPGGAASMDTSASSVSAETPSGVAETSSTAAGMEGDAAAGTHTGEAAQHAEGAVASDGEGRGDDRSRVADENKNAAKSSKALFEDFDKPLDDMSDLPPTQILIMRALQDEYMKFIKSKKYNDLPADMKDMAERKYKKPNASDVYKIAAVCDAYMAAALAAENTADR